MGKRDNEDLLFPEMARPTKRRKSNSKLTNEFDWKAIPSADTLDKDDGLFKWRSTARQVNNQRKKSTKEASVKKRRKRKSGGEEAEASVKKRRKRKSGGEEAGVSAVKMRRKRKVDGEAGASAVKMKRRKRKLDGEAIPAPIDASSLSFADALGFGKVKKRSEKRKKETKPAKEAPETWEAAPDKYKRNRCTLLFRNLPPFVDNDGLRAIVENAADPPLEVESVKLAIDKVTNRSLRYGYVVMGSEDGVADAVALLNGQTPVGKKPISVVPRDGKVLADVAAARKAEGEAAPRPVAKKKKHTALSDGVSPTVFVGNLPFNITKTEVVAAFENCGSIAEVRLIKNNKKEFQGCATVQFSTEEAAQEAMEKNGSSIGGRKIRMSFAKEKRKGWKGWREYPAE